MGKKILLLPSTIVPIIIIGFVVAQSLMHGPTSQATVPQTPMSQGKSFIGTVVVYFNDKCYGLSYQVVDRLKSYGAQVTFKYAITQNISDSTSLIIVFDGEWLEMRINDSNLHAFLRDTAYKGAKLMSIGGKTSKFFEALDKAGVCEIPITETDPSLL